MNKVKTICILIVLFFYGLNIQAQSMEDLINQKMKEAMEKSKNKNNKKGEKAPEVDIQDDKIIVDTDDSKITVNDSNGLSSLPPNEFIGSFDVVMNLIEKNGQPSKDGPMTMSYYFSKWMSALDNDLGADTGEGMRMVFDLQNNKMLMLMTDDRGNKSGIKRKIPKVDVESKKQELASDYTVTKTNETKIIDGHLCVKYVTVNGKNTVESWFTNELDGGYYKNMSIFLSAGKGKKGGMDPSALHQSMENAGMPLEIHTFENGKETAVMNFKNIKYSEPSPAIFSTDGYEIQDMSNLNLFGQ